MAKHHIFPPYLDSKDPKQKQWRCFFTGCSIWKLENCCTIETDHFWPKVRIAEMWFYIKIFQSSEVFQHSSAVCLQFFKKSTGFQTATTFGLYRERVQNASLKCNSNFLSIIFNQNTLYVSAKMFLLSCTQKMIIFCQAYFAKRE